MESFLTVCDPGDLLALNDHTASCGLTLTPAQAAQLAVCQQRALADTGRVEFGEGAASKLIRALCTSPCVDRETWADTLAGMTALFYALKSETHDRLTDEELIDAMVRVFDGRAHGAMEVLADMTEGDWLREVDGRRDDDGEACDDEDDD